jgi:hypothetical protein
VATKLIKNEAANRKKTLSNNISDEIPMAIIWVITEMKNKTIIHLYLVMFCFAAFNIVIVP